MSDSSHTAQPRLTIRNVLADAYRAILALDSPVLRVMRELTLRPGKFVRRYVEGERAGVVGPVKYALLMVTLLVLIGQARRAFFQPDPIPGFDDARLEAFYAAQDLRTYVLLLVLIPTAMVQRALFARWRFNLAETYAFLAYVFGHYVALGIVGALLPKFIRALLPLRLLVVAYVLWAMCDFYRSRTFSVIVRGLVVFATFVMGMQLLLQMVIYWRMGW